jgi:hypothetical protein
MRIHVVGLAILVSLPLLILGLFFWQPGLDVQWEDNPAHFWIVLAAALVSGVPSWPTCFG